ncbi:MAG: hypothetical protein K1X28_09495 [Parachlamydiales bacterium]|nr:hypothetical protein [Parachlamydiales bacterium]
MRQFKCPCCSYLTLKEKPPGTFEICPVCFWEDDNVQFDDPDYEGGANDESLNKARNNFREFGASSKKYMKRVRKPRQEEVSLNYE